MVFINRLCEEPENSVASLSVTSVFSPYKMLHHVKQYYFSCHAIPWRPPSPALTLIELCHSIDNKLIKQQAVGSSLQSQVFSHGSWTNMHYSAVINIFRWVQQLSFHALIVPCNWFITTIIITHSPKARFRDQNQPEEYHFHSSDSDIIPFSALSQ